MTTPSRSDVDELMRKLREAYDIIQNKPQASHEDVRAAFSKVLDCLGYPEINRLHERATKAGRSDTRLTTDEGLVHAIIEFKKPGALLTEDKLRDYMYDLRVNYGILTDGKFLFTYELQLDEVKQIVSPIDVGSPTRELVAVLYENFRKPESLLTPKKLLELLGGLEERPIPINENIDEFISKFRLSPTPFAEFVASTFRLYKFLATDPNAFAVRTFQLWLRYFAPTLKEKGGKKRFRQWREILRRLLKREPKENELYEFMFSLETAYALTARLILLRLSGDYDFGVGVGWLRNLCQETLKDPQLKVLTGNSFHTYLAMQIPRQFARLTLDFPSVFEEGFFDWWHDALRPLQPYDLLSGRLPEPVATFSHSLLSVTLTVLSFSFKDVTSDVLGNLYQEYFDPITRKALGEFYTPPEIVEYILDRVGYRVGENISLGKTIVDPACGSGTFLIKALNRYLSEAEERVRLGETTWKRTLTDLCDGLAICGLDINPFAVLIAQVNYLLQIIPFYKEARKKDRFFRIVTIPVFKTNTLRLPLGSTSLTNTILIELPIGVKDKVKFLAPTMKKLMGIGALNLVEASKLLRFIYKSACRAVEQSIDIDEALSKELKVEMYKLVKSDREVMNTINSLYNSLKNMRDRVGDGRLMNWVGDEFVVGILKSEMMYDFVVCNPPYVTAYRITEKEWKEYEKLGYDLVKGVGKRDIAYPFLEWGLKRLKQGGKLGFIMTDKWMDWIGRRKIRQFVLQNSRVIEIIDSSWIAFFEEAANLVAITILEKTKWSDTEPVRVATLFKKPDIDLKNALKKIRKSLDELERTYENRNNEVGHVNDFYVANIWGAKFFKDLYDNTWAPLLRAVPPELLVAKNIMKKSTPLSEIDDFLEAKGTRAFLGIATAGTSVFFLDEDEIKSIGAEKDKILRLTAGGSDIERWGIIHKRKGAKELVIEPSGEINWNPIKRRELMSEKRIVMPYDDKGRHLDLMNYPSTKKLIQKKAKALSTKRGRAQNASKFLVDILRQNKLYFIDKRGDSYIERKPLKIVGKKMPRIIWRDMTQRNSFALDFDGHIHPSQSCLFLMLKDMDYEKSLYYLGLLMSSIIEFYQKMQSSILFGGVFRFRPEYVTTYPLIAYSAADKILRRRIIDKVKEIVNLTSHLKDLLLKLQLFFESPQRTVSVVRDLVDPDILFVSREETTQIKIKNGLLATILKTINEEDTSKIGSYLTDLVDEIESIALKIKNLEVELNEETAKLYKLSQEDLDKVNSFLQRNRVWNS